MKLFVCDDKNQLLFLSLQVTPSYSQGAFKLKFSFIPQQLYYNDRSYLGELILKVVCNNVSAQSQLQVTL